VKLFWPNKITLSWPASEPAIHLSGRGGVGMDGRVKPGHDMRGQCDQGTLRSNLKLSE